jgi:small-conductance mechanosensitive channel
MKPQIWKSERRQVCPSPWVARRSGRAGVLNRWAAVAAVGILALAAWRGSAAEPEPDSLIAEPAVVQIYNRPVVLFRSPIFGYSPAQRAEVAQARLENLIAKYPSGEIGTNASTEGTIITIAGERAYTIRPQDLDPVAGQTMEQGVRESVGRLQQVMDAVRRQHEWSFILREIGLAALATTFYVLLVGFLRRLQRRLAPRATALVGRWSERLMKGGFNVLSHLAIVIFWMVRVIAWTVVLLATYSWLTFCLGLFPYTEPWGRRLSHYLFSTIGGLLHSALAALPDLFVVVIIVLIARLFSGMVKRIFSAVRKGEAAVGWLDPQAAKATARILQVLIWVFALIMAYPYLPGSNSDAFKGVSVFIGLLVSLGATSVVGQFTGGLVLMYSRALKPGEYVRVGEHEGTVLSVGFLSTKVLTPKREEVHLPNLVLLGTSLKNYSRMADQEGVLLYTSVTIGYNTPWRQVHSLLLKAAERTSGLRREPPPFVLQKALSDFYVEYELNVTLDDPTKRLFTISTLNANIQDLFNEYGVQIMSPHYVQDPPEKVWVPRKHWFEAPAASEPSAPDSPATPERPAILP